VGVDVGILVGGEVGMKDGPKITINKNNYLLHQNKVTYLQKESQLVLMGLQG